MSDKRSRSGRPSPVCAAARRGWIDMAQSTTGHEQRRAALSDSPSPAAHRHRACAAGRQSAAARARARRGDGRPNDEAAPRSARDSAPRSKLANHAVTVVRYLDEMNRAWTTADIAYLRGNGRRVARAIALELDISESAVRCAASRFRISLRQPRSLRGAVLGQLRGAFIPDSRCSSVILVDQAAELCQCHPRSRSHRKSSTVCSTFSLPPHRPGHLRPSAMGGAGQDCETPQSGSVNPRLVQERAETLSWLLTSTTPGVSQQSSPAARFATEEDTSPVRITTPFLTSTTKT